MAVTQKSDYLLLDRIATGLLFPVLVLFLADHPRHGVVAAAAAGIGLFLLMSWKRFSANRPLADAILGSLALPSYAFFCDPHPNMMVAFAFGALFFWVRYITLRAKAVGVA